MRSTSSRRAWVTSADLPSSSSDIPKEFKEAGYRDLGVNVDDGFKPLYLVPEEKREQVKALKAKLKGASELLLATDEDREGRASLAPPRGPPAEGSGQASVFHEITPEAISYALAHPRAIDEDLVRAQEARRILDRLYGYPVSKLLWKKIRPKLSAGRVQSVAVRLVVRSRAGPDGVPRGHLVGHRGPVLHREKGR